MARTARRKKRKATLDEPSKGSNANDQSNVAGKKGATKASKRRRRALGTITNKKSGHDIENNAVEKPPSFSSNGYQYTGKVDDIDERDAQDPLCATGYVQEMYNHYRSKETCAYGFLENHISERSRSSVVDWIVDSQQKFRLTPETLYLTVNLLDRYLEKKEVSSRRELKLVGATCLLIAAKYEEVYYLDVKDVVTECDCDCARDEVSLYSRQVVRLDSIPARMSTYFLSHHHV